MKGLVLAGGHGTRLRPLTFTGNKHMLPVANQPVLYYGLRHLAAAGIREVAVVLGPIPEGVREGVGDGRQFGLSVSYIEQPDPRGLADAVLRAREFLADEPFVMYLGDNLLQSGVAPFVRAFESGRPDAVIGVSEVEHPERYGVVELGPEGIRSIEEKPPEPRSRLALIGVYLFSPRIHEVVRDLRPSARGELEITDAIRRLWKERGRVTVLHAEGWWKDTGHPGDLLEANRLVLDSMADDEFRHEGEIREGAEVSPRVGLGPGSQIAPGARIRGPSLLGRDVRVSDDSQVGPHTALGPGVSLKKASVERSIVLGGSTIEGVHLVDSVIGRNVNIRAQIPMERAVRLTLGDSSEVLL